MSEKKILVVDDEEQILEMFSQAFQTADYGVTAAASGEAALEKMRQYPYPLVISDLKMPGMDGVELCRRINKDWPMTIVIAVTGYASLFELSDCREAGFEDYFTKPVSLKILLEEVGHGFNKIARWKSR